MSQFFPKISETLKARISGTETDINKRLKAFFAVFNGLSYQPINKLSKISMHMHFKFPDAIVGKVRLKRFKSQTEKKDIKKKIFPKKEI